jgi:Predicted nucleic acid-binding protein, contains PIN domain
VRLLDTDILIDVLRKHPASIAWLSGTTEGLAVPGIVALELYQGCNSASDVRDVDKLLRPLEVLWPTEADCLEALRFFPSLRLSHDLGLLDALIAALAIGRSATLCTFNAKHFSAVPGLMIEQPYIRY